MNPLILARLLWSRRMLRLRERWTRTELETYQTAALRALREWAYARSPFYQQFHRKLAAAPLQELPVLTKRHVMEHFDELVTDRTVRLQDVQSHLAGERAGARFRGRYWVSATSGSTGRPGTFLHDFREWTMVLASYARANEWGGARAGPSRRMNLAVVSTTVPWHQSALAGAAVRSWWVPTLRLDATEPLATIVACLNGWQPQALIAYASMAGLLAEEQVAGRLHISPRAIFTSSEVLSEEARRCVAEAWGWQPFDVYAATETAAIASECGRHAGLHLYEDLVLTEVVDQHNRPVRPGTYGEKVLATVLFSRTQPLIRYEISDSVCPSAVTCACGLPFALMEGIQGRQEEVLNFAGVRGGSVAVQPNVFHRVLDTSPAGNWQVVQESGGLSILVSDVRSGFSDETIVNRVKLQLAAQGAVVPSVQVRRVPFIPRGANGKLVLIRAEGSQGNYQ